MEHKEFCFRGVRLYFWQSFESIFCLQSQKELVRDTGVTKVEKEVLRKLTNLYADQMGIWLKILHYFATLFG